MIQTDRKIKGNGNWRYVAAFLSEDASQNLKDNFVHLIPEGWKVFCHHATIVYNDRSLASRLHRLLVKRFYGMHGMLIADAIGVSDKAIAVRLIERKGKGAKGHRFHGNGRTGHVTVAVAPGGRPVDSNDITDWKQLDEPVFLPSVIGEWVNE